ncbi:MAG: hypothetical protein PHS14_02830 [Elusimicrobia bacterium]|nr:hypothetical protein [Elusimicrobiota bacterium]
MRALLLALALAAPQHAAAAQPARPTAVSRYPTEAELLAERQRAELQRRARVEVARQAAPEGDILTWGKALFPDKFDLPFCLELHEYFVSIRAEPFTNVEAPRGHAKTAIKCFLIPIYQALVEPAAFRHYLNVQATKEKAIAVNLAIRLELEENQELRELYGDQVGETKWTDGQFVLQNGVVFSAIGAGQSIRGINYRNIRPDYVVIDDLYDEEDINNVESTQKKNAWFWGSLYKARAIGRRTSMHMQGTAINGHDLLEVLKKKKRWTSKTFRGVVDKERGLILWKELDAAARADLFADFEDMPTVIFNREVQNERRDDAESIVKKAWLANWRVSPAEFLRARQLVSVELGCDPSVGKTVHGKVATSDFTGIALVLKARQEDQPAGAYDYLIVGLRNERLSLNKRVDAVIEVAGRFPDWPATRANIEAISAFEDFAGEVRRKANLRVVSVSKVKDKITNLENKSGYFEGGRVFVSDAIPQKMVELLEYQLTTNTPDHDDLRDAALLVLPDLKPRSSWRPIA